VDYLVSPLEIDVVMEPTPDFHVPGTDEQTVVIDGDPGIEKGFRFTGEVNRSDEFLHVLPRFYSIAIGVSPGVLSNHLPQPTISGG
jgi:hypothetical protein